MNKGGHIYILTNFKKTVLYIGVTSDLVSRIIQHRNKEFKGSFTDKYNCDVLLHFEQFDSIEEAIKREKYLKGKSRKFKEDVINKSNSNWNNKWEEIKNW